MMRTAKALESKLKESQTEWVALGTKLVKKDETGNFVLNADKSDFEFLEGVNAADAKTAIEDFGEKEVIIDRLKFTFDDIAPAKLSPAELSVIECLLVPMETV